MRSTMFRVVFVPLASSLAGSLLLLASSPLALGQDSLRAVPFVYVGAAGDCGTVAGLPWPAGSNIVTSAWLGGMGLPDNGGSNTLVAEVPSYGPPELNPTPNANRRDPHLGLLLSKNGPTFDCSAAGAEIRGVRGMVAGPAFVLGFDYRNGGHCGGGAPRFDVSWTGPDGLDGSSFVGNCSLGAPTPASQDLLEWTQLRFSAVAQFPPIPAGSRIRSISIIFDEGTDVPGVEDPRGVGLAVVDNIFINGRFIRSGSGTEPSGSEAKRGGRDRDDD